MERKDLIGKNTKIFESTGKAINEHADKNIRILVVANPANTNCWTLMKHCPSIPKKHFSAMTRLDFNRERSMIAAMISEKLNKPVLPHEVKNCIIWGNHSSTQYPDVTHATYEGKKVSEILADKMKYLQGDFIGVVQQRGKAVIDTRGLSSAMSAAKAAVDHMRTWVSGTPAGEFVSMGVYSEGNKFGINQDLIYSFPVTCKDGEWSYAEGLTIDDFSKGLMKKTQDELESEKVDAQAVLK